MGNKKDQYKLSQLGVSMIELAMVVVIAALLVGSVMTYKSFIHASQLRSVITEVARIRSAISEFRDKYFAYPGDMTLAYSYWNDACGGNGGTTEVGPTKCNGNGDTAIEWNDREGVKAWQHMYLAGILQKPYNGDCTFGSCLGVPDQNIPQSAYVGGGFYLDNSETVTNMENVIGFAKAGRFGVSNAENILSTDDAYAIDSKLDDGLPKVGFVKAYHLTPPLPASPVTTPCILLSGVIGSPDTYNLAEEGAENCQLFFKVSGF